MPELQFAPLWRPIKINWRYPHTDQSKILDTIKSKRARKFLRSHQEFLNKHSITVQFGTCTSQEYLRFLRLYLDQVNKKNFSPVADDHWLAERWAEGKEVNYFFFIQHDALVAGRIYTVQNGIYRSAFKASDNSFFQLHHEHRGSLGLIIDFLWLNHVMQQSPLLITGGSSRNLFGHANAIGYLVYKMRLGFQAQVPVADPSFKTEFEQSTVVDLEKPWLSFLSQKPKLGEQLALYYGGKISDSNQYQDLLAVCSPQALKQSEQQVSNSGGPH